LNSAADTVAIAFLWRALSYRLLSFWGSTDSPYVPHDGREDEAPSLQPSVELSRRMKRITPLRHRHKELLHLLPAILLF
jgi:hypothetical protein